jgi:cytochrome bd-type quinol oxidase subunit 2
MCFSAAANFVGSGVLGTIGVITLTKVKHRRELLFASLPTLFAIHQFIEGFVWLGLDGILSPAVTHDMGAAFVLYAQGLLPFLMPLSIFLFEPGRKDRHRMLPFLIIGGLTTLYMLWGLAAYPLHIYQQSHSIVYINPATNNTTLAILYVIATCGSLFFSRIRMMVLFGAANLVILPSPASSSSRTSGRVKLSGRSNTPEHKSPSPRSRHIALLLRGGGSI